MITGTVVVDGRTACYAFTARAGGTSAPPYASRNLAAHVGDDPNTVRANREALEGEFACGPLSWMGPVHGVDLAIIDEPTAITPNVDALATTHAGVPLTTLGADCVPMLVVAGDVVVAAHVGWRGLVDGMAWRVRDLLVDRGIPMSSARVLLGPAICGACYGIPDERADLVGEACPEALTVARNGGPGADVRMGLRSAWSSWGAHVELIGPCTFESAEYFSHRRDGVTGRQVGVIAWQP